MEISPPLEDEFFREAVRHLCGSLQLETTLGTFFQFLCQHIPLTAFYLGRSNYTQHIKDIIVVTRENTTEVVRKRIQHSPEQIVISGGDSFFTVTDTPEGVFVVSEEHPIARFLAASNYAIARPIVPPLFFLRMKEGNKILGGAIFQCSPDNSFSQRDIYLLRSLRDPMLIALSNHFQYLELSQIKEQIMEENKRLRRELHGLQNLDIIGMNGGLKSVIEKARLAGPFDVPVLITGETGTGKEVLAKAVHHFSTRKTKPFVAVNCGAIPSQLVDSELFGHCKGAFTGALSNHKGRFERAEGGTIFLDEIGELPLEVQARLLRVLQEKSVEPVGGNGGRKVDFRLIAATNKDLFAMVRAGTFREDLYYRLKVASLVLPPLRQRKQDIPLLVNSFIMRVANRFGLLPPSLAPGEMEKLLAYSWPGNIRELENVVQEAMVFNPGGPLRFYPGEGNTSVISSAEQPLSFNEVLHQYFSHLLQYCSGRIDGSGGAASLAGMPANTLRNKLRKQNIPFGRQKPYERISS